MGRAMLWLWGVGLNDRRKVRVHTHTHPASISDIKPVSKLRTHTHIEEFDRILGGGIVADSAVLIGGTLGI